MTMARLFVRVVNMHTSTQGSRLASVLSAKELAMEQQEMAYNWLNDILANEDVEVKGSDVASELVAKLNQP